MQNKGRDMRQTKHGVKRVGAETSNPAEKHKASPGRGRGMGGGGGGAREIPTPRLAVTPSAAPENQISITPYLCANLLSLFHPLASSFCSLDCSRVPPLPHIQKTNEIEEGWRTGQPCRPKAQLNIEIS